MFGVENTVWLAPDNWKVKSYIPTTNVDLSYLGFPAFKIPGLASNITTSITSLEENNSKVVKDFQLYQNFPNPFNPNTKIHYFIPNIITAAGRNLNVVIKIYDVLGNEIKTLVNEEKPAGNYEFDFIASYLPSGVYFYRLQAGHFSQTKKMILLK
ncbi:MAG: T9SS type A sorting domain-containing protein [Ignavibacteriales bacterium]|nr:T9SS type A sorting domain-containing protein [Ignavibacteriales bacterium]